MSDFLNRLTVLGAPEAREVDFRGEKGTVYFRRISAAQREQLVRGMKYAHKAGGEGIIEIDLASTEKQKQMWVHFCVCDENGKPAFANLKDVEKLPAAVVSVLSEHAQDVNREDDSDLGKS